MKLLEDFFKVMKVSTNYNSSYMIIKVLCNNKFFGFDLIFNLISLVAVQIIIVLKIYFYQFCINIVRYY